MLEVLNMMQMIVEGYFREGCGWCLLGGIFGCKVYVWSVELYVFWGILFKSGLIEMVKWGVFCYIFNGKNVFLFSVFKNYCVISFFKGVLFKDDVGFFFIFGFNF